MLIAQANIALFRWPLSDSRMREFANQIDAMNQLAESSGGFVWRYSDEYDQAGRETPFDHPLLFFNMSVWENVESLRNYVFKSAHIEMLRRRAEWTRPVDDMPHWSCGESNSKQSCQRSKTRLKNSKNSKTMSRATMYFHFQVSTIKQ